MLTFWTYTSYTLISVLSKYATSLSNNNIDSRMRFLFSIFYALTLLLVLSWIVPNVFMGQLFGKTAMLRIIFISALLFYANTVAFVLWYMKQIKKLDIFMLNEQIKNQQAQEAAIKETRNAMITKWEGIDNHVVLFLVISGPIVFSPYFSENYFSLLQLTFR